ncbi:60S ribosome subunit biogenesis protein NIP7 homolog isoform X2 [Salmo salar]|uniref:60S ribosome subunit biogenesis protein NIP7 homolog isoform X2 n=1 Tax=Salmo salar TaxID=8030 RepID=A0ABM3E1V3_SALSA|nr:60S ribosome subunit biogenesis protein NIP7 homolog isoform X2 [Salmo salar]
MRPLTDDETKTMFEKLSKYIGENIKLLVDRPDGTYCFRLHNDRVYYISERILKLATNIARGKLVSVGTCFGKFTKTIKFRLHITALDFLAPYAKFKVWVKPAEPLSVFSSRCGLSQLNSLCVQFKVWVKPAEPLSVFSSRCGVSQLNLSLCVQFKVWVKPAELSLCSV